MTDFLKQLSTFDPAELVSIIAQIVDDPLSDLQATTLLLVGLIVITLLAVVVAILLIGYRDDDEHGDGRAAAVRSPKRRASRTPPVAQRVPVRDQLRILGKPRFPALVILSAMAIGWIVAGFSTGLDSVCMSCHQGAVPHSERFSGDSTDPHASVSCVRCHEPGGLASSLTLNVPGRAAHVVEGLLKAEHVSTYGLPAPSSGCLSCHKGIDAQTIAVDDRGLRVSHLEPLDSGALCVDCHELQFASGVVDSWTVGMAPCLRCHNNELASAECELCHTKDVAYAMHSNRELNPDRLVPEPRCGSCHDEGPCDSCHGIRMPHTREFIESGHPRAATLDLWRNGGKTCKRCHTKARNSCTKCHPDPFPGHPVTSWRFTHGNGGPQAGLDACNGCHGDKAKISGRNFCGVCHEEYVNVR